MRKIIQNGLVLYYDGINNASKNEHGDFVFSWYDLSGYGNPGAFVASSGTSAKWVENGFDLTNSDRYGFIVQNKKYLSGTNLSLEFTLTGDKNKSHNTLRDIFYEGPSIIKEISLTSSNQIYVEIIKSISPGPLSNSTSISYQHLSSNLQWNTGERVHITITINNNTIRIFLNGVLVDINTFTTAITELEYKNNFNILSRLDSTGANQPARYGIFHSVRIYNRALNENEVYYNYLAEKDHLDFKDIEEIPDYPDIPDIEPDIDDIIVPIEDGQISKIAIGETELYNVKDAHSRVTKLDKYNDDTAYGKITFMNGVQIDLATIKYDIANNTVIFK